MLSTLPLTSHFFRQATRQAGGGVDPQESTEILQGGGISPFVYVGDGGRAGLSSGLLAFCVCLGT